MLRWLASGLSACCLAAVASDSAQAPAPWLIDWARDRAW